MELKSLKLKVKEFIFTAFGNDKDKEPCKILFFRFPFPAESFAPVNKKGLFDGVNVEDIKKPSAQKMITEKIIKSYLENITAGIVDYKRFTEECIDHFEHFRYEGRDIITVSDFWQMLPGEAAHEIAREAYEYAIVRDEFTAGNLSA